jgi:3-hydroxyisobutyrate dehydrogenase-like beta-hydroxyacid dehydrogenase
VSGAVAGPVAVVGTGRMGGAMVGRLAEAGVQVVAYNRTRSKAESAAGKAAAGTGASVVDTAAEAVSQASVVLVSLADDDAVGATYRGGGGLAAGLRAGTVVLETSTIDPQTVLELRPVVSERGADLLDAPVSGSVPAAKGGTLTFMVGGEAAALERARPVLDVLGANVFHVGGPSAGATVKLAVNDVVHALNQALSEALVLAEAAGVDRATLYEVFTASAVAAPFVQYKRAAFERPGETPVAFSLDLVAKDLELIRALAVRVGAPMAQAEATSRVVAAAIDAGFGGRDMSSVAEYLRARGTGPSTSSRM